MNSSSSSSLWRSSCALSTLHIPVESLSIHFVKLCHFRLIHAQNTGVIVEEMLGQIHIVGVGVVRLGDRRIGIALVALAVAYVGFLRPVVSVLLRELDIRAGFQIAS